MFALSTFYVPQVNLQGAYFTIAYLGGIKPTGGKCSHSSEASQQSHIPSFTYDAGIDFSMFEQ